MRRAALAALAAALGACAEPPPGGLVSGQPGAPGPLGTPYAELPPPPPYVETVALRIEGARNEPVSHARARALLAAASPGQQRSTYQGIQAVALLESHYGQAWAGDGLGSNNWGAVHSACGAGSFLAEDSHPRTGRYDQCFRRYDSPAAGAASLTRLVMRAPGSVAALEAGDLHAFASALYQAGFFEGWGRTPEDRVDCYRDELARAVARIAKRLDEPKALD